MAFNRTKKAHGASYYQVVKNYRDEQGKHRQRVLVHLGPSHHGDPDVDWAISRAKARKRVVTRGLNWARRTAELRLMIVKYEQEHAYLVERIEKLERV